MSRRFDIKTRAGLPERAVSFLSTRLIKTGSWRYRRPVLAPKLSPCRNACPAGEDVSGWIKLAAEDRLEEAWRLIREANPLPGVCGRVCFHPCVAACNRGELNEALPIHRLERFVADFARAKDLAEPPPGPRRPERVAVVGGGPAGLSCAHRLARLGYGVTVFEAGRLAGGVLRSGIPAYRLPRPVLDHEIALVEAAGVEIKTNSRLGSGVPFEILDDFSAVFLAAGAPVGIDPGLAGSGRPGVWSGLDFLAAVNQGRVEALDGVVAVIGGGNTALDAARSALRLGGRPKVVYRRERRDMPALPDELAEAEREGVEFIFQAAPEKIVEGDGGGLRLDCLRTRPGPPDDSGRPRPMPKPGSKFQIEADTVITAVGERPDLDLWSALVETGRGSIIVDARSATARAGFFAGGDATDQPRTVVHAVKSGRLGAKAIDSFLRGEAPPLDRPEPEVAGPERINLDYFKAAGAVGEPGPAAEGAVAGFDEVNRGLSESRVRTLTELCFSCGACDRCGNCLIFCPDAAVGLGPDESPDIAYDYCKGCGICAEECPRGVISMREEEEA